MPPHFAYCPGVVAFELCGPFACAVRNCVPQTPRASQGTGSVTPRELKRDVLAPVASRETGNAVPDAPPQKKRKAASPDSPTAPTTKLTCIWTGSPSHKCDTFNVKGHPIFNIPVCYACIYEYFTGDFTSGAGAISLRA